MFVDDLSEVDTTDSGSGSGIWDSVVNAVSQTAQTAILANNNNSLNVQYPQPRSSMSFTPANFGQTSGIMSWLIVGLLILGGVFAFKKLK